MEDQQESSQRQRLPLKSEDDLANNEAMSLASVHETMDEEQGYDAPFATFTWRHWLDCQARAMQCFSRFLRAVEEHHPDHALMIGLEMQEISTAMLLEAYAQSANTQLTELPADLIKRIHF
ncbi:MAG TPA: hypothetical protein VGD98_24825 [Ktedonobacteraceae bacterium]